MNILHIDSEKTWRGGQNQTRLLMEGLLHHGISTHLAASPDSMMLKVMEPYVPTLGVKLRGGLAFAAARRISLYCEKHHITHIDAQGAKAHSIALIVKHRLPKVKLIVHRRVDFVPKNNLINRMKYLSKTIDAYVAISDAIGKILLDFGIDTQKVHVVKSCATPMVLRFADKTSAKQYIAKQIGLHPDVPWLGNVSALTAQKDYPMLLKALRLLRDEGLQFNCIIAGAGDLQKKLKAMATFFDLDDVVRFLGFRNDVHDILQALDILAVSSKQEGLGTIILDGLQAGCAVVSTNVGGIPEIVKHRETGMLVEPGDYRGFAHALHELLLDAEMRTKLNAAGQAHVKSEFAYDKMLAGNIRVYEAVS